MKCVLKPENYFEPMVVVVLTKTNFRFCVFDVR